MSELDFFKIALNQFGLLVILNCFVLAIFFYASKGFLVSGLYNPLALNFFIAYSTNYAAVLLLYLNGFIDLYHGVIVFLYLVVLFLSILFFFKRPISKLFLRLFEIRMSRSKGSIVFFISLLIYFLISLIILYKTGFVVFAETNRFEIARGIGWFVRLEDLLSVFIVAYLSLILMKNKGFPRLAHLIFLILFVLYSSFLSGAKISVIADIVICFFALSIHNPSPRKYFLNFSILIILGLIFAGFALSANLKANNVDNVDLKDSFGDNVFLEKSVHRFIANANTSYLLLPNNLIDEIETDTLWVRILTPIAGTTNTSSFLGYNVENYSVGRQAHLKFNPETKISGGPTSHFDYFSYVYIGPINGILFVVLLGFIIGSTNLFIKIYKNRGDKSLFESAYITTLAFRGSIILVEPTVGIAYLIDLFAYFTLLKLVLSIRRS